MKLRKAAATSAVASCKTSSWRRAAGSLFRLDLTRLGAAFDKRTGLGANVRALWGAGAWIGCCAVIGIGCWDEVHTGCGGKVRMSCWTGIAGRLDGMGVA